MQELSEPVSSLPKLEGGLSSPSSFDSQEAWLKWLQWQWGLSMRPERLAPSGYRFSHPLIEVLSYLIERERGLSPPPLRLELAHLSLHELCQLSLLWALAGQQDKGRQLAASLVPLLSFYSLFSGEESYDEPRSRIFSLLLMHSCAIAAESIPSLSDPYLAKLASQLPRWEGLAPSTPYNARLIEGAHFTFAENLCVDRHSIGALRIGPIEVRAIGPQSGSLNDFKRFGIVRSSPMDVWSAVAGDPSAWLKFDAISDRLLFHFIGASLKNPIALSCYLAADRVKIGEEIYQPQSLKRYVGQYGIEPFSLELQKGGKQIKIEAKGTRKMELIPLAGDGSFWNCNFLLAFEAPLLDGVIELRIQAPLL